MYILGEHLDARLEMLGARVRAVELGHELLDMAVLDVGLVESIPGVRGFAERRVEDLLLDLRMDRERAACRLGAGLHAGAVISSCDSARTA